MVAAGAAGLTLSFNAGVSDQVYTEALVAPVGPSLLSPLLSPTDPVAEVVGALTAPGLMRASPGGGPRLGLATSWQRLDRGSRYRFTLSPKNRWSDGAPVTTKDVAFTLAVLQSAHFPNAALAAPWSGVSLYASSLWAGTFVLPGPSANFAAAAEDGLLPAAFYGAGVGRYFQDGRRTTAQFPPSAGPFRVMSNSPDQVALRRNAYYRPRPHLEGFDLALAPGATAVDQLLAKGAVDGWLASTPSDLTGLPQGLVRSRITTYDFVELLMNEQAPPLQDVSVRRALARAVDRAELLRDQLAGLGEPQYGPLPDSISWAASAVYRPAGGGTVSSLLKGAGWSLSPKSHLWEKGGEPLSLTLDVPRLAPLPQAAAGVAAQLQRQGFLATVRLLPSSGFVSGTLSDEHFQLALVGFDNGPDPDLTSLFGSGVEPGQSLDFSQGPPDLYLNHALDALATAATAAAQRGAYVEVVQRLRLDLPAVFLYTPVDFYVHLSSVHVPGAATRGDPTERFRDVYSWSL